MSIPVSPITGDPISQQASAHSLQAFIELVYVKTANDVLVAHLASLENSLSYTKSAMDLLTQVQLLHNEVQAVDTSTFASTTNINNPANSVTNYQSKAKIFFGTPVLIGTDYVSGYAAFHTKMLQVKTQISSLLPQLSAVTPLVSGRVDSNSLFAKLSVVLHDINRTNAATTSAGAKNWITDLYNIAASSGITSAGLIQQHITDAITAGESLNTTQTESVRNYLYIYEEYYKSASAVLTQISQLIQKMADGIAR